MRISILFLCSWLLFTSSVFSKDLVSVFKTFDKLDWKIKAYKHRVRAARFRIEQSKAQKGFQFSLSSYLGRQSYKSYYGTTSVQTLKYYYAALSKPLYYPLVDAEISKREEEWEYSKIELKKTTLDLHKYLLQKFLDLKFNTKIRTFYETYLNLLEEKKILLEKLIQKKRATDLDLINAELSLIDIKEKIHFLNSKINADKEELIAYLGRQLVNELNVLSVKRINPLELSSLIGEVKRRKSVDISLAEKNVQIAKKELLRRKYLRYPRIDLQLSYSYTSSSAISIASTDKRISLILNFPVFQGGYVTAEKLEALENLKYYQNDLKDKIRDVEVKSSVLKRDFLSKLKEMELLESKIKLLSRKLKEVNEGVNVKIFSKFDYLKAKEDLINTEISYWQTFQSAVSDLVDYYYVSQDNDYFLLRFLDDKLLREVQEAT